MIFQELDLSVHTLRMTMEERLAAIFPILMKMSWMLR